MNESGVRGSLSDECYLRERVDDQIRWYGDKSAAAKRWFHGLQLATLLLAASVPVLALASGDVRVRIAVAVIGALTSVAAGLGSLYGFRERWVDYRSTAEALKHEKYLFLTGTPPYAGADAFPVLVGRVESILGEERAVWRERRLDLDADGLVYRKWGSEQRCEAGDWLVDNDGDVYSVDAASFAATYEMTTPGRYVKRTPVWAERATSAGEVRTKEGVTRYAAGDYRVSNEADGGDAYAVPAETFAALYEPID